MKQKYVYCIDESDNGWLSVAPLEVNEKDKAGFYYCTYSFGYESGVGTDIESSYLFKDENITWWRTPEAAQKALILKLKWLYLDGKLPLKHIDYDREEDDAEAAGVSETDLT